MPTSVDNSKWKSRRQGLKIHIDQHRIHYAPSSFSTVIADAVVAFANSKRSSLIIPREKTPSAARGAEPLAE